MQQILRIDLNNATYVGIDAHPTEHTAVAVNRFEEEKGMLNLGYVRSTCIFSQL